MLHTINMLKALELRDKRKQKLHIAGCPTVADSYGFYIYGTQHTVEVYFDHNKRRWIVGPLGMSVKQELDQNTKNSELLKAIRIYLTTHTQ